ncbi:MarR family winged helix-turn-helix transcriptional regulator [Yinghuangia aomiensis]
MSRNDSPTPSRRPDTPALPAAADVRLLTDVVTRLRRALRASIRTEYPWEALPMAQVELLQALAEHSPTRVSDLAARLHLATNTVSSLVGQMMTGGLVTRDVDPNDRRASVVALTATGRRQLDDWQQAHERRISAAVARLDPAEQELVVRALPALDHLVDHLRADVA